MVLRISTAEGLGTFAVWFIHIEAIDLVLAVVFRHYLMLILKSNHIEHHIQAMLSIIDMSTPELLTTKRC